MSAKRTPLFTCCLVEVAVFLVCASCGARNRRTAPDPPGHPAHQIDKHGTSKHAAPKPAQMAADEIRSCIIPRTAQVLVLRFIPGATASAKDSVNGSDVNNASLEITDGFRSVILATELSLSNENGRPGVVGDDSKCAEWFKNLLVNGVLGDGSCIGKLGQATGVDWVVFGTAWWNGSNIMVDAQLVPVRDPAEYRSVSFAYSKSDLQTKLYNA